ncbi:MAG: ABC transporter permease subunit [Protaetiibacter sp.]
MTTMALAAQRARSKRPRAKALLASHGLPVGLLIVLAFLVVYPLVRLQVLALEDGGRAYEAAAALPGIAETIGVTVALGAGSLVIAVVIGTALAWFAMRLPQRASWLSIVPILPMVLPSVAVVVGWAFLFSPQVGYINILLRMLPFIQVETPEVGLPAGPLNVYTVSGIVIVTGLQLVPLVFLFVQSSLRQLNYESIEAALVAGASPVKSFFTVVVPLLRPALVYSAAFAMLLGLGQLAAPQFLGAREGIRVLATEIYLAGGESPTDFPLAAAASSPLLIAGIGFILLQRALLRNDFRFVSAGTRGAARPLKSSRLAAPAIALFGTVTLVLPFAALLIAALSPFWTAKVDPTKFSLNNFVVALSDGNVQSAIVTSVLASVGAIVIALPLGYLIVDVLYRRRGHRVVRGIIDIVIQLPLGVPAIVFGVGLLFVYTGNPFLLYGSTALIIITYVILVLPFTVRMQLAARMTIGSSYEDAAHASGAGAFRTHLGIVVPMMRGGLVGAAVIMFVILTHEFAASMFVRSTRTPVLGTVLYDFWSRATYPMVATISIIMAVVTGLGLLIAVRVGGREALSRL